MLKYKYHLNDLFKNLVLNNSFFEIYLVLFKVFLTNSGGHTFLFDLYGL